MQERMLIVLSNLIVLMFYSVSATNAVIEDDALSHKRFCLSIDGSEVDKA